MFNLFFILNVFILYCLTTAFQIKSFNERISAKRQAYQNFLKERQKDVTYFTYHIL